THAATRPRPSPARRRRNASQPPSRPRKPLPPRPPRLKLPLLPPRKQLRKKLRPDRGFHRCISKRRARPRPALRLLTNPVRFGRGFVYGVEVSWGMTVRIGCPETAGSTRPSESKTPG